MSQTQTAEPVDVNAAYSTLWSRLHVPAFTEKLAARGITPRSEQELNALLEMGMALFRANQDDQEKRAQAGTSFILSARDNLMAAMSERGLRPPGQDTYIKSAAQKLAADPELQKAALAYQDYLAGR